MLASGCLGAGSSSHHGISGELKAAGFQVTANQGPRTVSVGPALQHYRLSQLVQVAWPKSDDQGFVNVARSHADAAAIARLYAPDTHRPDIRTEVRVNGDMVAEYDHPTRIAPGTAPPYPIGADHSAAFFQALGFSS
jgi:hypothetical protein